MQHRDGAVEVRLYRRAARSGEVYAPERLAAAVPGVILLRARYTRPERKGATQDGVRRHGESPWLDVGCHPNSVTVPVDGDQVTTAS
jgi:hypothetical protein